MTAAARAASRRSSSPRARPGRRADQAMTLIAHVLMTMRWNRSRWVPRAWATAALIGSACDTHTIVPPGWAARSRSSVDTMRCCISEKLSPPGKRNVDGARCTVCHSGFFISFGSSAPVHSPKSHSSRPRSTLGPLAGDRGDRRRRLAGPLERRRVDGVDLLQLADPLGRPLRPARGRRRRGAARAPGRAAPCPSTGSGRGGRGGSW